MSEFYDDFLIDSESGVGIVSSGPQPFRMLGNDENSQAVVYKAPFDAYAEETTGLINNDTTFAQFLRLSFNAPEDANYKITWNYVWSKNDAAQDIRVRLELDDTSEVGYRIHQQESKDVGGAGEVLGVVGGGTQNTGTNQRHVSSFSRVIPLTAGAHFLDLDWECTGENDRAALYGANILVEKMQS